jgi:hypothetical protein
VERWRTLFSVEFDVLLYAIPHQELT